MASPKSPERNTEARSFRQLRRFLHLINADKVFGTHTRRAIDDEEFRPPQPAIDEVSEDSAPGLGALAAHALDREQHLLAVLAHAENDQQRDRCRLAVEPHAHHGAVEDQAHNRPLVSERVCQASQSLFTLRQVRLTVSLPTVPPNKAASARRTRRVLAPARYVLAITASAASVRR